MRNPLRKGRWLRETMTDLHATRVPVATDTYMTAFVPLERIAFGDLATIRWIADRTTASRRARRRSRALAKACHREGFARDGSRRGSRCPCEGDGPRRAGRGRGRASEGADGRAEKVGARTDVGDGRGRRGRPIVVACRSSVVPRAAQSSRSSVRIAASCRRARGRGRARPIDVVSASASSRARRDWRRPPTRTRRAGARRAGADARDFVPRSHLRRRRAPQRSCLLGVIRTAIVPA